MKICEVMSRIDEVKANVMSDPEKIKYLDTLDRTVMREIIERHEADAPETFCGYTEQTDRQTELLIYPPYDEAYIYYLSAMIDYSNGETALYNNSMSMFESVYDAFARDFHRTHMPKKKKIKFF